MDEKYCEPTQEISLIDLYLIIKKNIMLIIIFTGLFFAAATFYVFKIASPMYKSSADVMIQVEINPDTNSYDYVTAQRLVTTIAELIRKDIIINEALLEIDTDLTASQVRSNLTVTSSSTSFFININYIDEDPVFTKEVVDAVIDAAITVTNENPSFSSLSNKLSRTSFAQEGVYDSPNRLLFMVIGAILGGIVGLGTIFIKEFFRNTYQTKEQLEQAFGIQVIGVIPKFETKETKK